MKLHEVNSSTISAIGYDPVNQTLQVNFKTKDGDGSPYTYAAVPADLAWHLLNAESTGKFFASEIKGKFDYSKRGDIQIQTGSAKKASVDRLMSGDESICLPCASRLGGTPVLYAVGIWIGPCSFCGTATNCTALRDYVWGSRYPQVSDLIEELRK